MNVTTLERYSISLLRKQSEGISARIVKQYRTNFKSFIEGTERVNLGYDLKTINSDVIRRYIAYLLYEHIQFDNVKYRKNNVVGLSPVTVNTRLKTLRVMFNTLNKSDVISANPMAEISPVRENEHTDLIKVIKRASTVSKNNWERKVHSKISEFEDYQ